MNGPLQFLTTPRLTLRRWRDSDREPFAGINSDPRVMEHFPAPLGSAESDALIKRIEEHFETHGFGPWAVEHTESGELLGFTGLYIPTFSAHFTPCIEIGWRIGFEHWNRGYETEAAQAALDHAITHLHFAEVVSFTVAANHRSRRVMEKLGMHHNPVDDFDHPLMEASSPLSRHVLYRITRDEIVARK